MVQSSIPSGLQDPKSVLGSEAMIFGELLGWGQDWRWYVLRYECQETCIYETAEIYNDRKQDYIKDEIVGRARELSDIANE